MKKRLFSRMWVMCCLFLALTGLARHANALTIIGPDTVCIGTPVTYTVSPDTPGRSYTWVVDPHGNISGPSITDVVTVVWASGGTALMHVTDQWGTTAYYSVYVVPTPKPFITTNFSVACQSLPLDTTKNGQDKGGGVQNHILTDQGGCIRVCDSTNVRYYANGDPGGTYSWTVTGGTITTNYGDSIDVFWPAAGTVGSVTLTETVHGCPGTKTVCIQVTQRPNALFAIAPSTTPAVGIIPVCSGTTLNFTDLSTGDITSPIVSWYWNFGDGNTASIQNPTHTFTYMGSPLDTVTLVVRNACNCTDTYRVVLNVFKDPGPDIQCVSVACLNDTATYSTGPGCGVYNWTVTGGTIVSGMGTPSIVVKWNAIGASGFGYVSLNEPCGPCPGTTTIKVPVILPNGPITGTAIVCTGKTYEYYLPLWPGTQYSWGCIGNPSAIIGLKNDYKVAVMFTTPGTYTLHAWYQNNLKLCGGDATFTITVTPPTKIIGDTFACAGQTKPYNLSTGSSGNWTLVDPNGNPAGSGSGTTFSASFPIAGAYTLYATSPSFCDPGPYTIYVQGLPPAVASITGPDTVCLNRPYTYTAGPDVPGTVYNWVATGGTVVPASGSNIVTVTWTSGPTMTLSVFRTNIKDPNCPGPQISKTVRQEVINPKVTGPITPCENSYANYTCNYTRGEVYDWAILPITAGSVMSGTHSSSMQVLWNNYVGTAKIVSIVKKCDSTKTDTLTVNVIAAPLVVINPPSPNPACPGTAVSLSATPGAATYTWNFGDGTSGSGVSTTHPFPVNTTTGNMTYTVSVTVSGGSGCPPTGTGFTTVTVKPGPVAYASTPGPVGYCPGAPVSTPLIGTVTNNVLPITYQWFTSGGAFSGSTTSSTALAVQTGSYWFVATGANGCQSTSNIIVISTVPCVGPPGPCGGVVTCSSSVSCNTITLTGGGTGTIPQWYAGVTPPSGPLPPGTVATATYSNPGIYTFTFSEYFPGLNCTSYCSQTDTISIVPKFSFSVKCAPGNLDSVFLSDNSPYLPGTHITSIQWFDPSAIGTGSNLNLTLTANNTYTVTEVVAGYDTAGHLFSCTTSHVIKLPAKPIASFRDSIAPICENVPVYFFPIGTGGISNYNWMFGDGASSILQNPQRNYTWLSGGNPEIFTAKLTVTDTIGCTDDTIINVSIFHNLLAGTLGADTAVCAASAPVQIHYSPNAGSTIPIFYEWSNGVNTSTPNLNVGQSGTFWATVLDANQCQITTKTKKVNVIQTPIAQISGQQTYCYGDAIQLYGYAGSDPSITYAWTRNSAADGTTPSINDAGLAPGVYIYQLTVTATDPISGMSCSKVSAPDTVTIYSLPSPPTINGPAPINCSTYHLQLYASGPGGPGTYTWSNGTYGATDDIYVGGPYRLWFTDNHGCRSYNDMYVPLAPNTYFPYFPSGCYTLCKQQLPDTLYGPPGVMFYPWSWLMNGGIAETGTGYMLPYGLPGPGTYQWDLNNGLCDQQSPPLNLNIIDCNTCQVGLRGQIVCSKTPAGYTLTLTFNSPAAGTTYTLGTNIGPLLPFSGTLGSGFTSLTLSFTTLTIPPPATVTVEVVFTLPGGKKCYQKVVLNLPKCDWIPQRRTDPNATGIETTEIAISTAMMVYPNPATDKVNVSYDFGNGSNYNQRTLTVFDMLGRKVFSYNVPDAHGNWSFNSDKLAAGIYLVHMEGDGKQLQVQRLTVTH